VIVDLAMGGMVGLEVGADVLPLGVLLVVGMGSGTLVAVEVAVTGADEDVLLTMSVPSTHWAVEKATSWMGVHSKGVGLPSKVTQTWPVVDWQNSALELVKATFCQTRTLSRMAKVAVMAPTVGAVQKGW